MNASSRKIAVGGLGYVGLPAAVAFGRSGLSVTGFDTNARRISELSGGHDRTGEVPSADLCGKTLNFTSDARGWRLADFYIVTVPTPIDASKQPNLEPLRQASSTVGQALKKGDIVVYESTVYPVVTENICVPILEKASDLKWKADVNVVFSPERICPGVRQRRCDNILKIVSADPPETLDIIDSVY